MCMSIFIRVVVINWSTRQVSVIRYETQSFCLWTNEGSFQSLVEEIKLRKPGQMAILRSSLSLISPRFYFRVFQKQEPDLFRPQSLRFPRRHHLGSRCCETSEATATAAVDDTLEAKANMEKDDDDASDTVDSTNGN
ncbi:hypothetical protein NLI96_g10174 [Meripilus lineatus]|uniref:Uncharacterized protein n=1 Tax=Meripilus lineatus TaxID=2056292 RepID=A0AAD5UU52_9APHY|nr:hypothetical protein NLI96_g10174 [Physisporinus lineatus]